MTAERLDSLRARLRARAAASSVNPRDADLLLSDCLGKTAAWILGHGETVVGDCDVETLLQRRIEGEPLQYIRGRTEFFGREFLVDGRVLIPRPETEILVETAVERIPRGAHVVDVGTGSGCIGVTLSLERPDLRVTAADLSIGALALARANRDRLGAPVALLASNVLEAIGKFDFVVSNPPYIPQSEFENLAPLVRDHEPRLALTPGLEGTEVMDGLLAEGHGCPVILEIGYGQSERVRALARRHGYEVERIVPDLAAIPRVVVLSRHGR